MKKLKVTQVRSTIKRSQKQKDTMTCLGLGKINKTVIVEATPQIQGMVNKVSHLVTVEEV